MSMTIEAIAACTPQGVIGKNGTIPWYFPEDLQRFKRITSGHTIIMGRKTYESLGNRPLRGRHNIVVSRSLESKPDIGLHVAPSLEVAIDMARQKGDEKCFLIGGQKIYEEGLHLCEKVHLTKINMEIPEGEAFFPVDLLAERFVLGIHEVQNQFVEYMTFYPNAMLPDGANPFRK